MNNERGVIYSWVVVFVDCRFTRHSHHARRKAQRRHRLLHLFNLSPNVGHEECVALTTDGVLEAVRQFGLAEGHVLAA